MIDARHKYIYLYDNKQNKYVDFDKGKEDYVMIVR